MKHLFWNWYRQTEPGWIEGINAFGFVCMIHFPHGSYRISALRILNLWVKVSE